MRGHHQNRAFPQDPSTDVVCQGHAPELTAVNIGNSIVTGKSLIKKRVIRGHEVQNIPVLFYNAPEKQQRFLLKGLAQIVVEVGKLFRKRLHIFQVAQVQPLAGERCRQRFGLRIGKHSTNFAFEDCRSMEVAFSCRLEKLVVRNSAPQEERQTGRQFQIADRVDTSRRRARGLGLDMKRELWTGQYPLKRPLDASFKTSRFACGLIELHQPLDVDIRHIPAIGPLRQRRNDFSGARFLVRSSCGTAGKNLATAGRVAGTGRIERTRNHEHFEVRVA